MRNLLTAALLMVALAAGAAQVVDMRDYGVRPGSKADMSPKIANALQRIAERYGKDDITLEFAPGIYNMYPDKAVATGYFISNHDQTPLKRVGINIDGWTNLTINGNGAMLMCHGRMIPVAVVGSAGVALNDFDIDFADPQITQITIEEQTDGGIIFRPEDWTRCRVDKRGRFITAGHGWELMPRAGIAFDPATRHMVYRTSDIYAPLDSVVPLSNGSYLAPAGATPPLCRAPRLPSALGIAPRRAYS